MNDPIVDARQGLFSRHGHLTMLTLDRFDAGELTVEDCEHVIEHLRGCPTCTTRLDDVQADAPAIEPPAPKVVGRIEPDRHRHVVVAVASTLAAAALLLLVGWPRAEQASRVPGDTELTASSYTSTTAVVDELQPVGIELRVVASGERLHGHDYVPADTRVTVDVGTAAPGYVALLAVTENSDDEEGTGGMVEAGIDVLLPVSSTADAESIRLHSEPLRYGSSQSQRVVGVYCPEPFELTAGRDGYEVVGPEIADNCESVEFELVWTAEAADS